MNDVEGIDSKGERAIYIVKLYGAGQLYMGTQN